MEYKKNINLIVTTAFIKNNSEIFTEIKETFDSVQKYGGNFNTVVFLETVDNIEYDFIKNSKYKYVYSDLGNTFKYKGINWMNHMTNYIKKNFEDNEIIVFLTGRYTLINDNIFNLIERYINNEKYNFIAKNDGDIYKGEGVHTFFITFLKGEFLNFSNYYFNLLDKHPCIEVDLKNYMEKNKNCLILPKETILGIRTNISETKLKKNC